MSHGGSKYTPDRVKAICDLLEEGNTRKTAATCAGINPSTFHKWMNEYEEFVTEIEAAEHRCYQSHVANIKKHSKGDWRASQFILSRRDPDWADKAAIDITTNGQPIVGIVGVDPKDV